MSDADGSSLMAQGQGEGGISELNLDSSIFDMDPLPVPVAVSSPMPGTSRSTPNTSSGTTESSRSGNRDVRHDSTSPSDTSGAEKRVPKRKTKKFPENTAHYAGKNQQGNGNKKGGYKKNNGKSSGSESDKNVRKNGSKQGSRSSSVLNPRAQRLLKSGRCLVCSKSFETLIQLASHLDTSGHRIKKPENGNCVGIKSTSTLNKDDIDAAKLAHKKAKAEARKREPATQVLDPTPIEAPTPTPIEAPAPTPIEAPTPIQAFDPTPAPTPIQGFVPAPSPTPIQGFVPAPTPIQGFVPAPAPTPIQAFVPAPTPIQASAPAQILVPATVQARDMYIFMAFQFVFGMLFFGFFLYIGPRARPQ